MLFLKVLKTFVSRARKINAVNDFGTGRKTDCNLLREIACSLKEDNTTSDTDVSLFMTAEILLKQTSTNVVDNKYEVSIINERTKFI